MIAPPEPRNALGIRQGTMDDVPFLDSLQKLHTKLDDLSPAGAEGLTDVPRAIR